MSIKIRLRRGSFTNLPTTGMSAGEPLWSSDRGTLHVASDATTTVPVVPAIDELNSLTTPVSADSLIIHDDSEAGGGVKEKRVSFANLKTALNIPDASTDEKVATSDGATSGYLSTVLTDDGATIDITEAAGVMTVSVPTDGIGSAQIAAGAVDTSELASNAVTTIKITDLNVTTGKLAASAVTTAKINDDAVTNAKLASTALDVSATHFSGNGVDTTLEIAEVDGGAF